MQPAPIPADEALRQRALDDMELLDTPAELYLDTLVRLTRELFQVETALISLVDRERQWFKARIGLEMGETPRDISFCGHAVAARQPLMVEDALLDPRFADNPAVTGPPFIRFYAGQPLFSQDQAIGTLCLLHPQPRSLSQQERSRLRDLAILVEGYLQLRSMGYETRRLRQAVDREQRKALIDPLTQLWNRAALNQFFEREMARAQDAGLRLGDATVAAYALLLYGLLVAAFALDGLAHAVEALCGHAIGARDRLALRRALLVAGGWSLLGSLLFALLFLLGGRLFIELQSDILEVRNAAYPYLPYLALLPLIAVWSYLLDGLFIGATRAREMRDAMLCSTAFGLLLGWLLQGLGNHGLWLALLCFMLMRGLSLAILGWRLQRQDAWLATSH